MIPGLFRETPIIKLVETETKSGRVVVGEEDDDGTPSIEVFSYRADRLKKKEILENKLLQDYWNETPLTNYPFKKLNLNAEKIIEKINKKYGSNSKKSKIKRKKTLKLLHWNANGIVGKIGEIKNMILEWDPDVISLNETKTNSTTENYLYLLSEMGFFPIVKNRYAAPNEKDPKGGGVALLFKDNLNPKPILIKKEWQEQYELVGGEIGQGANSLSIFSWYVPPNKPNVSEDVVDFMEKHGDFVLMGDLNARCPTYNQIPNVKGKSLERILNISKSVIVNKKNMPTNYTYKNGEPPSYSTIDLVIANEKMSKNCTKFQTLEISSVTKEERKYFHLPVYSEFEIGFKSPKTRISHHKSYLYDKADWVNFKKEVDEKMMTLEPELDITALNNIIERTVIEAAEKYIPKSSEKLNRDSNFDAQIVEVLKTRNFWGKRFRLYRDKFSADNYMKFEKLSNELIEEFRITQWNDFLYKQGPHPLSSIPFWKRVNRLRSNKRQSRIETLIINDITYESASNKANIFAKNLEDKFRLESNVLYNSDKKIEIESFFDSGDFDKKYNKYEKKVKEFNLWEIDQAIKVMNTKTSRDPMGLSNRILKNTGPLVRDRLLTLFNWCLIESVVPESWKHSVIRMLLKNGQPANEINSYRPISMTSCVARLFERMVLGRLRDHLDKNKIIIQGQSGFRKARQTKDNLLTVIQTAQEGFNVGEKTLTVFFDIAAAFDKVWHAGVLYKLHKLGVPYYLIRIIGSFLHMRTFTVKIDDTHSEICKIECGVPQGGVLSPTLFQVYINDIPMSAVTGERVILFADDIAFIKRYKYKKSGKKISHANSKAQIETQLYLGKLESWMNTWRLSLAPKKCCQITFSRAQNKEEDILNITLYGEKIKSDPNPKFLGVVFDRKLNFESNVEAIKKKTGDRLNLLKILSYDRTWRLNTPTLVAMYKSLVLSVLDYAAITVGACSQRVKNDYEVIQNNALRIILKISLLDKVRCEDLRIKAGVKSISERHKKLMRDYYERALITNNPLISDLFEKYKEFKMRNHISPLLAMDGSIENLETLNLIKKHNALCLKDVEAWPTTFCLSPQIIKNLILDSYDSEDIRQGVS